MTTDNTRYWNQLASTDPAHVKPISGKRYRGGAIKPEYRMQKMTEAFGPAGEGWGWRIVNRWREDFPVTVKDAKTQAERLEQRPFVFVEIAVWWRGEDGEKHEVGSTIGGTAIDGADADDAYKKAITDALGKCLAALGCCADVYLGAHDGLPQAQQNRQQDQRTDSSRRQSSNPTAKQASRQQHSGPPAGVWQAYVTDISRKLAACKTPGCASKVRRSIEDDLAVGKISQPTHAAAVALCKPRYDELEGQRQKLLKEEADRRAVDDYRPPAEGPRLVRDDEAPAAGYDADEQADADYLEAFRGLIETSDHVGRITAERKKLGSMGLAPATVAAAEAICDRAIAAMSQRRSASA